ncbi:MAG: glutamate carboxypeptidase [Acidimicrobiaceae bacterium]|nr:glutamate carboxypeptidase [Acidimicrobiaceae bacterium]
MLDLVADLVAIESPSADRDATARCAGVLLDAGKDLLGEPGETVVVDGTTHVRWRFGSGSGSGGYGVLLVGHLDTVWPTGTLARWPFAASADDDRATGPGAFDMKAGLVQLLFALATLDSLDGLTVLVTADEEIGSPSSRQLIVDEVTGKQAALVLEPGVGDALKTARKGVSNYEIEVVGRAAHAGLEPERGANATVELAHQVLRLTSLARPEIGTTVTPTVAAAGTTTNTVPAEARLQIDVRALTVDEQHRVDREIRSAAATVAGTTVRVGGGPNRPPLPATASAALMVRAKQVAAELGLAPLHGVEVGGGSDGNFTAGAGVPTLDGLGAVGGNAHAEGEFLVPSKLPERAALVAGLIDSLRAAPLPG